MQFIHSGTARLCVVTTSAKARAPALICLHAGVADRRMWGSVQAAFGEQMNVVAYDRRGFGLTTYQAESHSSVDDLIRVLNTLQIDACVLMGCSMGAGIALEAALKLNDRVKGLLLVCGGARGAPENKLKDPTILKLMERLKDADRQGQVELVNRLETHLWLDGPLQQEGRVKGSARHLFLDMNGIALRAKDPGKDHNENTFDRLAELRVPTLLIAGELDLPSIAEGMEQMSLLIPDARYVCLQGSAHLPSLDQPRAFMELVEDFLPRSV